MVSAWPEAVMEEPSIHPPPGFGVDSNDPQNLATADYVVLGLCIVLSMVIVFLRLYSKKCVTKSFGRDDAVFLAGWIFYVIFCAFIALMAHDGMGRHQWNIRLSEMENIWLHLFIDSAIYCAMTALIKAAVFLQLLNFFKSNDIRGSIIWSCWGFLIFFSTLYFALLIAGIFICSPVQKYWILSMSEGHCGNRQPIPIMSASANIAADMAIISLPQWSIWQLDTSLRQKIRVSIIFGVGLLALGASIARLHYALLMVDSPDATWNANNMGLWTLAEVVIIIACSSTPSIYTLIKTWKTSPQSLVYRALGCCTVRSHKHHDMDSSGAGSCASASVEGKRLTQMYRSQRRKGIGTEGLTRAANESTSSHDRQDSWLSDPPVTKYISARAYEVV